MALNGLPRKIDLRALLLEKEDQLVQRLDGARRLVGHSGLKGEVSEGDWKQVIDDFLPRRYTVSTKTQVMDNVGGLSDQIDLVIHDRHFCPIFFERNGVHIIPAESVFAVFEVKQEIDKGVIDYTHEKIESVRDRARTNGDIIDRGEIRNPRTPFDVLGGVLALESSWNPPFGQPLEEALRSGTVLQRIDLGCAARSGAFEATYPNNEFNLAVAQEAPLVFFLHTLFARLQSIGSPMVIDLHAYTRPLETDPEDTP
jgi:hypothetical protein